MKTLYLDCFSGISGDMLLGALIDCGADRVELERQLSLLPCHDEFSLDVRKTVRFGIMGTDLTVHLTDKDPEGHHHDHNPHSHRVGYTAIADLINKSGLSGSVKRRVQSVFSCIADAEAHVHGTSEEQVHFHEVGAVDSIVDICGVCIALDLLDIEQVLCSPINLGGGIVECEHGVFPVPAPATVLILRDTPSYGDDPCCSELTTPTGAALVKSLCTSFGTMPPMRIRTVGYGLGKRETGRLNVLRVMLGDTEDEQNDMESVTLLEANIDDMTGEALAYATDVLRAEGALDVYLVSISMKKGRPAHLLCVLCAPGDVDKYSKLMLVHTSTLGVRIAQMKRRVLARYSGTVETPYGPIRYKHAYGADLNARKKPEFEDCAAAAKEHNVPLDVVQQCARAALEKESQKT